MCGEHHLELYLTANMPSAKHIHELTNNLIYFKKSLLNQSVHFLIKPGAFYIRLYKQCSSPLLCDTLSNHKVLKLCQSITPLAGRGLATCPNMPRLRK